MDDPEKDLRSVDAPASPSLPGGDFEPSDEREPLVIPPEQLREHYQRLYEEEMNRERVHVAEYVKVRSWGQVFSFMRLSMRTYNLAREHEGFAAGGIRAKWWRKEFWTYSVWEDEASMKAFAHSIVHRSAADRIAEFAAPGSCYVTWVTNDPPEWDDAIARLQHPTRYFVEPWAW